MGRQSRQQSRSGWLRFRVPVLVLVAGALAFGWLAYREGKRAEDTAQVLMEGYAAFIADKFEQKAAARYKDLSGFHTHQESIFPATPFDVLRQALHRRDAGEPDYLPPAAHDFVLYYFAFDSRTDRLQISSGEPTPEERRSLAQAVRDLPDGCVSGQLLPFCHIGQFAAPGQESFGWSGLVRAAGEGRQAYGFRVDQKRLAEILLLPLISPSGECACPSELLPSNLASISDIRQIAIMTLRDAQGRIFHRSGSDPESMPQVPTGASRPLPASIPFPGWTLEVAIHPQASEALLPFRRGLPWTALGLLGLVVGGSALLAVRALRRNEELLRLRQDFVSNVSHELKTPLARIRLFNELLMEGKQKDLQRRSRYRRVIDRECRRLTFLIENVLNFSRRERGGAALQRGPVDLKRLAGEALETFRASTDPKRTSFTSLLEDVPAFQGDAAALQQAVINLLDNAVKYSPPGSPVQLSLFNRRGRVRLEVRDEGRGIAAAEQERIFEEFYRSESGDEQEVSGSGLGLALVRRTVRDHGGRVHVESRPGQGSTFVIELPAARRAPGASAQPAAKAALQPSHKLP